MKTATLNHRTSVATLHDQFLAILPRIETHGRVYFRDRHPVVKDECLAEMVALCWKWFVRLHKRGKNPSSFVSAIASYAARAVRSGRRLCGTARAKDVLSPYAQRLHGFSVCRLPDCKALHDCPLADALIANTQSPPDEQAAFRVDFPAWLRSHTLRHRRLFKDLMHGERTKAVARKYGVSAARISQVRREFFEDWLRFRGEVLPSDEPA
jgi:hypothetical protein